jgi:hypothetical protein
MTENQRVTVELIAPTRIAGVPHEAGDFVEVYPFEKRSLIASGYVKGDEEDMATEGEKAVGALNVLKKAEDRDDVDEWTIERAHKEGWGYGRGQRGAS